MPKANIDYSETSIYKIYCKDDTIKDIYVGHTTNFYVRKYQHKTACNAINNKLKIYKTIRENGGWNNWNMVEIAIYNCKNLIEARIKEQYHYVELKASLNSIPPYVDKTQFNNLNQFNADINDISHINKQNIDVDITPEKIKNPSYKYYCEICDYTTSKKSSFDKHILTVKHKMAVEGSKKLLKVANYECKCGKQYKYDSGYYRHKQNCNQDKDALLLHLLKQNGELQNKIIEMSKQTTNNI